ncbi:MAG: IS3 family transposase [Acidimicrobiia bacterium]
MTAHIAAQRADHGVPVAVSCRALGVSESWFYKHHGRPPTRAQRRRDGLDAKIIEVFEANRGEYGSPRVHADLVDVGEAVSVNTVAASMARLGLVAKKQRRRRCLTKADPAAAKFDNVLARNFGPSAPDVVWCGDITEIKTWDGKLYLATVLDLYSRRLLGWAVADHCRADLVCDALRVAVAVRGGVAGMLFHSDRGSQYTSGKFVGLCQHFGIGQSMSRTGSCLDNAVAESFFATLKTELVYRSTFMTKTAARERLAVWFHRYNHTRRHSYCGLVAPITYETATVRAAEAA